MSPSFPPMNDTSSELEKSKKAFEQNPKDPTAQFKYGVLLHNTGAFKEAADILCNLIKRDPNEAIVYVYASKSLNSTGMYDKASEIAQLGLQKNPAHTDLLQELSKSLLHQGNSENAIENLEAAIENDPENMTPYISLASAYATTLNFEQALLILQKAVAINDKHYGVLNTIGVIYNRIGDFLTASKYFLQAARLEPTIPEPLMNLASCFDAMDNTELALKFFDEVLKLNPNHTMALCTKANVVCKLGMAQEELPAYKKGLNSLSKNETQKNYEYITHHSNYIFYMHYSPTTTRKEIFKELTEWQKQLCQDITEKNRTSFENTPSPGKKLRIGYFSTGFAVHPVGQMIITAIENIDKSQFETYIYSDLEAKKRDILTDRFEKVSDKFIDVSSMQNAEITDLMREHKLDILIEMTGYCNGGRRLTISANRVAPVQVKWVGGLFNTTGLPQMDWILADKIEIPEGDEKWYTESIYRMPDDYIVYHPPYYAPDITPLPAEKNGFITFGNLNNLAKTNSYSIMLWAKILHAVPNSKLLLKTKRMETEFAQEHIITGFASHGISANRLIFEGGEKHQAFMDVYNRIDIALDPHPYTGGLTTCEALWMGVPVVTLPGETFAGKHAATHLTNAGLPEWIAASDDEYVAIAQKWATDIPALAELRAGLRDKVAASPLVDGPKFAKNFEIAMRHMWKEWCDLKTNKKNKK
jgi:predicted O-linked N-acetylglucosamine transferase (SPINDLY family)